MFFKKKTFFKCWVLSTLIVLFIDFLNYSYFFNFLKLNIIFENSSIWRLLFYFNNNNNNIFIFLWLVSFFIKKYTNSVNIIRCTIFYLILLFIVNLKLSEISVNHLIIDKLNNLSLINGLLIIHPIYIYMTYICIFIYFLKINFFKNLQSVQSYKIKTTKKSLIIICISLFSVYLGSYWAQQELNWGGWWNWDYVELIAFIFLILLLYTIHFRGVYTYINHFFLKTRYFLYIVLFYVVVRCDILNSVHSFNSLKIMDKYIQYLYVILFYFFINSLMVQFKIEKIFKNFFFKKNISNTILFFNTGFILLLIYNFVNFYYAFSQIGVVDVFLKIFLNTVLLLYVINQYKYKIQFIFVITLMCLFNLNTLYILICLIILIDIFLKKNENKINFYLLWIHFLFIILWVVIINNNNNIFLKNFIDTNVQLYNYFIYNNNNILIFKTHLNLNLFTNSNFIDNLFLFNWSGGNGLYSSINVNLIYTNSSVQYNLDDTSLFVKIFNLAQLFFTIIVLFVLIIYYYNSIFFKSDIV